MRDALDTLVDHEPARYHEPSPVYSQLEKLAREVCKVCGLDFAAELQAARVRAEREGT